MEIVASDSLASFDVEVMKGQHSASSVSWDGDGTAARSPFPAVVTMNRELHSTGSERSCLHVELDFNGSQVPLLSPPPPPHPTPFLKVNL